MPTRHEQGLGEEFSMRVEGDGATLNFRPIGAPRLVAPPAKELPTQRANDQRAAFQPVGAPMRARHVRTATSVERRHPYAMPAHNTSRLRPDQEEHARTFALRLYRTGPKGA